MAITTIEGLSEESVLTSVQKTFLEKGAVQCGFRTPGMVLSVTALLQEHKNPTETDIRKALEGNLCRCTGYNKILEAVNEVVQRSSCQAHEENQT